MATNFPTSVDSFTPVPGSGIMGVNVGGRTHSEYLNDLCDGLVAVQTAVLAGSDLLSGSGAPGSGVGSNGDFYIDTVAHDLYGPKTSGAWGSGISLVGPAGADADPELIRDTVAAFVVAGSGISVAHDDGLNTLTISASAGLTSEQIQDMLSTFLVEGANIDLAYNDAGDALTIAVTGLGTAAFQNTSAFEAAGAVSTHAAAVDPHGDRAYAAALVDDLSGVTNAATARSNLSLGGAATLAVGTTAGTVAAGDDARMTNARTPTAHAASHADGGADEVTLTTAQITGLDTALGNKADLSGGVVPSSQIPAIAITEFLGSVATQGAMLALSGQKGDWAIRTDLSQVAVITGADPTQLSDWTFLAYPTAPVTSVNGETGVVTLSAADVGADASGAAAAAQAAAIAASQPIDSDLTAIAALTTTVYGRSLLALADAAAARSAILAYATTAELANVSGTGENAGSSDTVARGDHKHDISTGTPVALGASNAAGTATSLARSDHVHAYPTAANVGAEASGTAVLKALFTTKGDILGVTASGTVARRAAGADGTVLSFLAANSDGLTTIYPPRTIPHSISGTLTTSVGDYRIYNDTGRTMTIRAVRISVGTAPTGSSIIADVNKNGSTIFSTQANRPTISISGNTSGAVSNMNTTSWAAGEYLTLDIDQIGSTIAGANLVFQVECDG